MPRFSIMILKYISTFFCPFSYLLFAQTYMYQSIVYYTMWRLGQSIELHIGTQQDFSQMLLVGGLWTIYLSNGFCYAGFRLFVCQWFFIVGFSSIFCQISFHLTPRMFNLLVPMLYAAIFKRRQTHANTSLGNSIRRGKTGRGIKSESCTQFYRSSFNIPPPFLYHLILSRNSHVYIVG